MNYPEKRRIPHNSLQLRLRSHLTAIAPFCQVLKKPPSIALLLFFYAVYIGFGCSFAATPEVRTVKNIYTANEEIEIIFANLTGHPKDWMALARRGAPDRRPLGRYKYLGGVTSGQIKLPGVIAGEYEVRAYKGGSHEVLARYQFQVQASTIRRAEQPEAADGAQEEMADTPLSTGRKEPQTSPEQPLQAGLQRFLGNWIGHTRCDIQGSGRDGQQKIFLRVREDRARPSGIVAEMRGIGSIAGVVLDVSPDTESQQYIFSFAGWSPTGRGNKQKPYGLRLAFLHDKEMLHGEIVTDGFACEIVVVGKLPSEAAPPNPYGLLFKVAKKRVLQTFTEDECAAYGQWLAAGENFQVSGWRSNTALGDGPAMREVLGHDLGQWTDDDTRKIEVIHRTCLQLLRGATDPALVNLGHDRKLGGLAAPLRLSKSKYPGAWDETFYALNRPLVMDLLKTWELLDEGLLEESGETMTSELQNAPGLGGEWRGYYQCDGGHEVFMRLAFTANSAPLDVRLEIGSSLRTAHPFGVLAMTGSFNAASGQITLKPHEWILEPRGQNRPLGIEGQLSDDEKIIEGRVEGPPNCSNFSVAKREVSHAPVNPDGLLFHYLSRDMITADLAECRNYAEWLAAGEEINLGGTYIFSDIRNAAAMRAVLGKNLSQWGTDDSLKMSYLSRHCKALLESQMDTGTTELLTRIKEKRLVWAPKPLTTPREDRPGETTPQWLLVEQLVMVNAQQRELAARKLVEAENLPAELASIDQVDALTKEAGRRMQGPLGYLSQQELDAYLSGLLVARVKTAVATADATADSWQSLPATYAGLEQLETQYKDLRQKLNGRKAQQGVDTLDAHFRRATDLRADALWPEIIRSTVAELNALAESDLLRFGELGDDQVRQVYLSRFHAPRKQDYYFSDFQQAWALYRETVERMVERSKPQLLAWIDDLPPSDAANDLLAKFSEEVFGLPAIPERHPGLKQAATAKMHSYNPDRYQRPDIIMSLRRGQWNEVGLVGLEDLAYMATSLRIIEQLCPTAVPKGSPALMNFVWNMSQQAVRRILQGQVKSRKEAERAFFLLMNNVINQPGCRVDYFGNVVGCVSHQDHAAVQNFFMTSFEAQLDMKTLLRSGCGPDGANGYVQGLVAYAEGGRDLPPSPAVLDFWAWVAPER